MGICTTFCSADSSLSGTLELMLVLLILVVEKLVKCGGSLLITILFAVVIVAGPTELFESADLLITLTAGRLELSL